MTQEERQKVGGQWSLIAAMHGKDLSISMLKMMIDAVDDLPGDEVFAALTNWVKVSKQARHPFPAELREIVRPAVSLDYLAIEAANRIPLAISRFGWCNPAEARAFIGELGWGALGGEARWQYVCENHGLDLKPQVFHAQIREIAKAHAEMARSGTLGSAPALPEPKNKPTGLQPATNILKLVTGRDMPGSEVEGT